MFTELVKSGKKVIMLTVDSVLSGTYETCRLAARQVMADVEGADIRIIDSKTAACPISMSDEDCLQRCFFRSQLNNALEHLLAGAAFVDNLQSALLI